MPFSPKSNNGGLKCYLQWNLPLSDNCGNLLNEHMHTPELAPVIVVMETVPKHKIPFYYWSPIVSQMNFNAIVAGKKEREKKGMKVSKLFSDVCN